jgi:hypothetical protein
MKSFDIPADKWLSYFDAFSQEHVGWPATIEVLDQQRGPQKLAGELPLQGISFEPAGSRPCTIQVGAGDRPDATISHVIDLPLHIRLADDEQGELTIQIEPARGAPTLVRLHEPVQ